MDELRRTRLDSQNWEEFVSSIGCIRGQSIFIDERDVPERVVAIGDNHRHHQVHHVCAKACARRR